MNHYEYWEECISEAANQCNLTLTPEQLKCLAENVQCNHENYGMAFYSPPASDRCNEIDREWKRKFDVLQREFGSYKGNAETAVKKALRQHTDANVSIGEYGEVTRYGGRTERIQ